MEIETKYPRATKRRKRGRIYAPQRVLAILLVFAFLSSVSVAAQSAGANNGAKNGSGSGEVARGKYIVENVAMCGTCHTQRDDNGQLEQNKWLDGASLWLQPSRPTSDWPLKAPRIAGNPPGSDADIIKLLTTGVWQDNQRLRAPMPQFCMTRDDAEAVLAYLKSLNSTSE